MTALTAPVPFAGELPHPRHDPDFHNRILTDLTDHRGTWRRLGQLYAGHVDPWDRCNVVREAVEKGRRLGLLIEGDRRRGYRFTGWQVPEMIYLSRPGGRPTQECEEIPGQLSLVAVDSCP